MRWKFLHSATARLVGIIFFLVMLAMAAVLVAFGTQAEAELRAEQQARIETIRDDMLAAYYDGGLARLVAFVPIRLREGRDTGLLIAVSRDGTVLAGNIDSFPAGIRFSRGWQNSQVRLENFEGANPARLVINPLPDGAKLVVGHLAASDDRIRHAFAGGLAFALFTALLLSALTALLLGQIISKRASAIADTARALGRGELGARVSEDGSGDGFDRLRHEVNIMAGRIERLVSELRMVTDSLAHDLRTPVMRLRTMLESAGTGIAPDVIDGIEREMTVLENMLSAALEISRVESGSGSDRKVLADIAPIIKELADIYDPFAEDQGVSIMCKTVNGKARVNRELLARALSNLIDNAIKYGAHTIWLDMEPVPGAMLIHVRDDGPGIAVTDRKEALRRFGRLDESRGQPGAGLGLALVDAIARFHDGSFSLGDNNPGLVATILLPVSSS